MSQARSRVRPALGTSGRAQRRTQTSARHELDNRALAIGEELGDELGAMRTRHNMACTLREMGRLDEAQRAMRDQIPQLLRLAHPDLLVVLAEDYAAVLAEVGDHQRAVRMLAAADAMRQRNATPRPPSQQAEIQPALAKAQTALAAETWDREYQAGYTMTVEDALTEATPKPPT